MTPHRAAVLSLLFLTDLCIAQPALTEPPEFPRIMPGPSAVQIGQGCFYLARGTIIPGDVDWVQFSVPRDTTRTIVDVDFPAVSGASATIASVVNGSTGFNSADNNSARDAFCGLGSASTPLGNTRDSVIDLGATPRHAVINIGITGASDTSFIGLHTESFTYDLWVYVLPINCTTDQSCDDLLSCTVDHCDVASGVCDNAANNSLCDNGVFCDGAEFCDTVLGCRAGIRPSCDDGVECTIDYCDADSDQCMYMPDDFFCDDNLFCNGWEICDTVLGCVAGPPQDCDDGNGCTTDTCDENAWECTHTFNVGACDDGLFCNGVESCDATLGCQAGAPPNCDDGNGCTTDTCDENAWECTHTFSESACDDGLFCNGVESCDATLGCQAGAPPNCDDGVACTADSCDENAKACGHRADDSLCDDGLFCNGVESCDATLGCQAGAPPNCDDGVACTVDSCDENAKACKHTADVSLCDDGLFCNGVESCDATLGCQAGAPPNCDDGVTCTVDSCDDASASCVHTPTDSACDDGQFCNGAESCDLLAGCVAGKDPCPGGMCRESDARCVQCLSNADCDDGVFCNGAEACDSFGQCALHAPPCTADQTCSEAARRCEDGNFALDLKPGACPNRFNTISRGQVQAAVMGTRVGAIDVNTLTLSRQDGVGGSVPPLLGPHGPRVSLQDVSAPPPGGHCTCGPTGGDGALDLVMQFDLEAMVSALRLNQLPSGTQIMLRVSGRTQDGSSFEASDCATVQSPGRPSPRAAQ